MASCRVQLLEITEYLPTKGAKSERQLSVFVKFLDRGFAASVSFFGSDELLVLAPLLLYRLVPPPMAARRSPPNPGRLFFCQKFRYPIAC